MIAVPQAGARPGLVGDALFGPPAHPLPGRSRCAGEGCPGLDAVAPHNGKRVADKLVRSVKVVDPVPWLRRRRPSPATTQTSQLVCVTSRVAVCLTKCLLDMGDRRGLGWHPASVQDTVSRQPRKTMR